MRRDRPFLFDMEITQAKFKSMGIEVYGAWFMLLGRAWMNGGSLPDNDYKLAKLARVKPKEWKKIKSAVLAEFHKDEDGRWSPNFAADQFALVKHEGFWIDDDDYEDKIQAGRFTQ